MAITSTPLSRNQSMPPRNVRASPTMILPSLQRHLEDYALSCAAAPTLYAGAFIRELQRRPCAIRPEAAIVVDDKLLPVADSWEFHCRGVVISDEASVPAPSYLQLAPYRGLATP